MKRELRNMAVRFITSLVFLVGIYVLLISFREKALEMIENIPENFKRMVGEDFIERLANDEKFYIISQWNWKNLAQILPVISIIIGFPMLSRELENGTVYLLFSNRSRERIFLEKFSTGALFLSMMLFVASILPIFNGIQIEIMVKYSVHAVVAGLFWYSLAFFTSSLFDDQVKPLIISLGIFITSAVLEGLRVVPLNVLSYIGDQSIYAGGGIDVIGTVKYLVAFTILFLTSLYRFKTMEV